MTESISARLKRCSRGEHAMAERNRLMSALARGEFDARIYGHFLAGLHRIYSTLEEQVRRHAGDASVRAVYFPVLERREALERDLRVYFPRGDAPAAGPGARTYMAHLRAIGGAHAYRLAAHTYVRYMGDMSGGQMIRGIVAKTLGVTDAAGLSFFDFGAIGGPEALTAFKEEYRRRLDGLALSAEQRNDLEEEARLAFRLNLRVFADCDALLLQPS